MIRHVVLFKFKPVVSDIDRDAFKSMLHQLQTDIPLVKQLETGDNFTDSPRACDLVLLVDVDDEAALKEYGAHPLHQPVLKRSSEIMEATYIVDYVLP